MNAVLDTSFWYAFIFLEDKFHPKAKASLITHKPNFKVPYPVIEELAAIIHGRKGKKVALTHVYQALVESEHIEISYINPNHDQEIWQIYQQAPAQIDYVDASVIWLSRQLDLPIFTFDRHFKKFDLPLIP